jgi:hypothetical protein
MHDKFRTTVRKIWRLSKSIIWGLILAILLIGWLSISGLNFYCAIALTCNPVSLTWWGSFFSVFGLPILAVQMYLLRKTFEEGTWKPNISIGFLKTPQSPQEVIKLDELPTYATINLSNFIESFSRIFDQAQSAEIKYGGGSYDGDNLSNRLLEQFDQHLTKLVIRNKGKSTAKSIKIQILLFDNYPYQTIKPKIRFDESKSFLNSDVLVVNLKAIIHPDDFDEFIFSIISDPAREFSDTNNLLRDCFEYLEKSREIRFSAYDFDPEYPHLTEKGIDEWITIFAAEQLSKVFVVGKYTFEVKVWADGIKPVTQKLILEVTDFSNELKKLFKDIASEASRFENDPDHHFRSSIT